MIYSKILKQYPILFHCFDFKRDVQNKELLRKKIKNIFPEQIHSNKIAGVNRESPGLIKDSDGLVTDDVNVIINVKTADCLPIMFYEPVKGIISGIHAGWKGLYLKIIRNAVNKIVILGGDKNKLKVAIGPHIRPCCYKVEWKRVRLFQEEYGFSFEQKRNGSYYLDLEKIAYQQLIQENINKNNIDIISICTCCNIKLPSYRRDGAKASRLISALGLIN